MNRQKLRWALFVLLVLSVSLSGCMGGGNSKVTYKLTIKVDGKGSVIPFFNDTREFNKAEIVELEAVADEGWEFIRWEGDVPEPTSPKTTVNVDSNKTVTAVFRVPLGTEVEVESGDEITFTNGVQLNFGDISLPGTVTVKVDDVAEELALPGGMSLAGAAVDISFESAGTLDFSGGVLLRLPVAPQTDPTGIGVFHFTGNSWEYLPTRVEDGFAFTQATSFSTFAVLEADVSDAVPEASVSGFFVQPGTRIQLVTSVPGAAILYSTTGDEFPGDFQLYEEPLVMPDDCFEFWALVAEPNKLPGEVKRFWFVTPQHVVVEVKDALGQPISGFEVEFLIPGSEKRLTDEGGRSAQRVHVDGLIAFLQLGSQSRAQIGRPGETITFVVGGESAIATCVKTELTFNPVEFSDPDRLNPFSSAVIREAMNRFVDRHFLAGLGPSSQPMWTFLAPGTMEYDLLKDTLEDLEAQYSYNKNAAQEIIHTEMEKMGAELKDGIWHYGDRKVELIFLIRTEDERKEMGDHIADELESIGFVVKREYVTVAQAAPIYKDSDPADGLWHLYTNAWIGPTTLQSSGLGQFYTPEGVPSSLWQAYDPPTELRSAAKRLVNYDVDSLGEYKGLYETGLALAMQYSPRIWLSAKSEIQ
jgi:hypothetical protein